MTHLTAEEEEKMTNQLKALYETKKMLEEKYRRGRVNHIWCASICPLCRQLSCAECPFHLMGGCHEFTEEYYGYSPNLYRDGTPIDETLSVILAMIDAYKRLEEMG